MELPFPATSVWHGRHREEPERPPTRRLQYGYPLTQYGYPPAPGRLPFRLGTATLGRTFGYPTRKRPNRPLDAAASPRQTGQPPLEPNPLTFTPQR